MSNNNKTMPEFILTDNNAVVNVNFIRWIKNVGECYYICSKTNGCDTDLVSLRLTTHQVCKNANLTSYTNISKLFNNNE